MVELKSQCSFFQLLTT